MQATNCIDIRFDVLDGCALFCFFLFFWLAELYVVPVFITSMPTHIRTYKDAGAHRMKRKNNNLYTATIRSMCRSNRFNHKVIYANDGCVSVCLYFTASNRLIVLRLRRGENQPCRAHVCTGTGFMHRNTHTQTWCTYSAFFPLKLLSVVILVHAFIRHCKTACHCQFVRIN